MLVEIFQYICAHADSVHFLFIGLYILAGLNLPISEDLLLLTGGALVSRCIPDKYLELYLYMFFASWISGWETYWLGRLLGPNIYHWKWFSHIITKKRIAKLHSYYEKFGIFTFIVGRFIPGGIRNALFLTSGLGKMPFPLFMIRDFIGALISTSLIFYLGYLFGENYELIAHAVIQYDRIAAILVLTLVVIILIVMRKKKNAS